MMWEHSGSRRRRRRSSCVIAASAAALLAAPSSPLSPSSGLAVSAYLPSTPRAPMSPSWASRSRRRRTAGSTSAAPWSPSPSAPAAFRPKSTSLGGTVLMDSDVASDRSSSSSSSSSSHGKLLGRHPDVKSIERRIVHLGRIGRTDEALALYAAVWEADDADAAAASNAEGNSRSKRARRHQIKPSTRLLNHALDACARAKPPRLSTALQLFDEALVGGTRGVRRIGPNVFTFGALLSCCARARDAEKALDLLKSMQDDYKIVPNAVVYSTAISACERSVPPRPQLALELLNNATSTSSGGQSIEMGIVGYNAALSAMARAGEWKMAVRFLDEMEAGCSKRERGDIIRGEVDDEAAEHKRDETEDASLLCPDAMPPPPPDAVTYGTVMAACERSGEWDEVLRFADAATQQRGMRLDGLALTSALHACQRLGLASDALKYLDRMKELGGDGGDDEGDVDRSREVGGSSVRTSGPTRQQHRLTQGRKRSGARPPLRGPDEVAYRLAISACARSPGGSRWIDGVRLLDEMRETTKKSPDVVAYTAAIAGCAEAGEWTEAFKLLSRMKRDGVEPNVVTYSAVIGACASASAIAARRNEEGGLGLGMEPLVSGGESQGCHVLEDIRLPMRKALQLLESMKKENSTTLPNIVTYNAAIRACAEGLNLWGAFDLVEELRSRGLKPTIVTYGSLMTACERTGNVEGASKVFRMMREAQEDEELKPNEVIYGAAISCCRKAGEPERALLLLRKMLKEELSPNTATFNTVIVALTEGKAPLLDKALAIYKIMRLQQAPRGTRPNRQTYNLLVRAMARGLRPFDAESLLKEMRSDGIVPDVDLFTNTVAAYEKTGNPMKALRLMESMQEDGYDFYEVKVLNEAFKKAVKLVSVVGRGLGSPGEDGEVVSLDEDLNEDGLEMYDDFKKF